MKNIKLWLIAVPLLSIGCTTDSESTSRIEKTIVLKTGAATAENPLNPYDYAGRAFDVVLDAYSTSRPTSIGAIADGIDATMATIPEISQYPHGQSLTGSVIQIGTLSGSDSHTVLTTALSTSALSSSAKSSFSGFVGSLDTSDDTSYQTIHVYILAYEAEVLNNSSLTAFERQAILTSTSIARYSFYRKKRKDKDWEGSIWAIAGAVYGAQQDVLFGAKMATATGLCHNYNIGY